MTIIYFKILSVIYSGFHCKRTKQKSQIRKEDLDKAKVVKLKLKNFLNKLGKKKVSAKSLKKNKLKKGK